MTSLLGAAPLSMMSTITTRRDPAVFISSAREFYRKRAGVVLGVSRKNGRSNMLRCMVLMIVTNMRRSNVRMIHLNRQYGFEFRQLHPDFYEEPNEDAIIMERRIDAETGLTGR
jgi:ribosomal protein S18 acetylase RimI-like enzyme